MKTCVLAVATHPDDETLGCGGTLFKHRSQGDKIYWLIVTGMREENGFRPNEIARREMEISKVSKAYGFDRVFNLNLPTTKLDKLSKQVLVTKISGVIGKVKPDIVYVPFRSDVHSDHRMVFDAVYSCTKSFRYPFIKKVMMMEVLSETEFAPSLDECSFSPNYFVDITRYMDKKLAVMNIYKGELRNHPFPRSVKSIKALATFRGSAAGCKYAESFSLLRAIE